MKKALDRVHPVKHFKKSSQKPLKHRGGFHKFARQSARFTGKPIVFGLASLIILSRDIALHCAAKMFRIVSQSAV